jgi:hypothetical protein
MATAFGHASWIGFASEVTYGTPVASAKYLELLDENVSFSAPTIERPTLRSLARYSAVPGKKSVGGSFKVQMPLTGAEYLLTHAMMQPQSMSGAGPYVHTWNAYPASYSGGLSLHINRNAAAITGSSSYAYHGCQVRKMTLVQEPEDFLTAEFEVIGEDMALEAAETPTFPTFSGFHWAPSGTGFSCAINSTATPIKRFELSVENPVADDRYHLGSRIRAGLGRSGPRKVSGSIDLEYSTETHALYNTVALGGITCPILFDWNIGAANRLQLSLPAAYIMPEDPAVSDSGVIPIKFNFEAFSADGSASEISVVLTNSTATY